MTLIVLILQIAALGSLAATMHAAPPALKRRAAGRRPVLTIAGWSLLAVSAIAAPFAAAGGQALLAWFGTLSVAGALVLLLSTRLRGRRAD